MDTVDLPLEDIDRIEVIRGPGGTIWGANAVNGVISIFTKRAADTTGALVTAQGGDILQGATTLQYGGKWGADGAYRVYGNIPIRASCAISTGIGAAAIRGISCAAVFAPTGRFLPRTA